ncbi:unnamed protein product [Spodoptera exigua]|nr:unnamed protein product [Spodoptera exigua]
MYFSNLRAKNVAFSGSKTFAVTMSSFISFWKFISSLALIAIAFTGSPLAFTSTTRRVFKSEFTCSKAFLAHSKQNIRLVSIANITKSIPTFPVRSDRFTTSSR